MISCDNFDKMEKYPCGICKKEVKDNQGQGSLQCCVCERWIHKACGIPDHVYKLADEMFCFCLMLNECYLLSVF